MPLAIQLNVDREHLAHQLIAELRQERDTVWSLYCHVAELMPFSANKAVRKKLAGFAEILIDYVSLGHFGICEFLFVNGELSEAAFLAANKIYPVLTLTTEAAVAFNDKYENDKAPIVYAELKQDLSALGENLAARIDLEDRLCELMLQMV